MTGFSSLPVAVPTRRAAADVKAGRRPPDGPGLDTSEDRCTLSGCGNREKRNIFTTITQIMPR
jgi:hypothetical protein